MSGSGPGGLGKRYRELLANGGDEPAPQHTSRRRSEFEIETEATEAAARLHSLAIADLPDDERMLDDAAATLLARTIWMAQQMLHHSRASRYELRSGSSVDHPMDWNADITRSIFGRWLVEPQLDTLVALTYTRHAPRTMMPGLFCGWTVVERIDTLPGESRVLLEMHRRNARTIPWQSFDSTEHLETSTGPGPSAGTRVVFCDGPNLALPGDTFFLGTRSDTELDLVGRTARRAGAPPTYPYFYDDSYVDLFRSGPRVQDSTRSLPLDLHSRIGRTSDIDATFPEWLSGERFERAEEGLKAAVADEESLKRIWRIVLRDRQLLV